MTTRDPVQPLAATEAWHARPASAALAAMTVLREQGPGAAEVRRRRDKSGPNSLPAPERQSVLQRFLPQFHNALIYVLLGAALVTLLLGHFVDSVVILGVVLVNAVIGYIQEGKAEAALDAIRKMLAPRAQVLRAGHRREVHAERLVPGDIVFLAPGDRVPADLRLLELRSLRIEVAALTGEWVPVENGTQPVAEDAPLGDRDSMAHAGTLEWGPDRRRTEHAGPEGRSRCRPERESCPRVDAIPFESEHRFMATLHHDHRGDAYVLLKGAPERVLELCAVERRDDGTQCADIARWHERMEEVARQGMRLIALAAKPVVRGCSQLTFAEVEAGGFHLLAVAGMADPARPEAIERCRSAGTHVKMIAGDDVGTARGIGARVGLAEELEVLTGRDIEALGGDELGFAADRASIFARASPEHKLRLVQALQARGDVVAMTGDGVNDAPALQRADVGVAMGQAGTEATKEAAQMVLVDDKFASIAAAVEEGRPVYDNVRKAIAFILPTHGGEAGLLLVAIALGLTLPITPVQILWVNVVTAVTLALALAFETAEQDIMLRPRCDPAAPLVERSLARCPGARRRVGTR